MCIVHVLIAFRNLTLIISKILSGSILDYKQDARYNVDYSKIASLNA